ncbi:helical backbone metal receptor [Gudongella sp. DL1XJH-153]|uniref:helical backbone metal receptor n=1 Tax=Gudongella sp. DL1XJH-153 TaxID=3409804 RepID=UPI003BB6D596
MKKGILILLAMMLAVGLLSGCSSPSTPETPEEQSEEVGDAVLSIEDDFGNTINFGNPPEKIISLAPSNTEILFAVGAGDKVVGVTSYDDYPEEVLDIEKIGDFNGINLERIIELEPDLVINYGDGVTEENERLLEAGIQIAGFEPESLQEVYDTIIKVGKITGHEDEAKELVEEMTSQEAELAEKIEGLDKKTVFYEIWHEPLMAAGPGSFVDELINRAGGENVAADADGEYPQFDLEQLIERNPQVYITANDLPEKTADSIKERPGYSEIDAIKNDRVYLLDGNIMSRPGPRIIDALKLIIEAIHPEINN